MTPGNRLFCIALQRVRQQGAEFPRTAVDIGINDEFMKGLAQNFRPGCAAVFILLRKVTADKVLEGLSSFRGKGKVLQTSLEKDREDTLREFLEAQSQEGTA